MDVSIIIVNYNTKELLRQCINSIYQNVKDISFEIIVTDNASSDGSTDMLEAEFPSVNLIKSKKNGGFAYGNNLAIKQSKGRYIFLLNSDTIIIKDVITKMVNYMDKNQSAGMIGPKLLNKDLSHQTSISGFPTFKREFYHIYKFKNLLKIPIVKKILIKISGKIGSKDVEQYMENYKDIEKPQEVQVLVGAALLIRRKIINDIGLLDERYFMYYEEIDYCYQAYKAGWKSIYYPNGCIIHLIGQSGERTSKRINEITFYERYKSMIKYFRKNHGKTKEILVRINLILGLTIRILANVIIFIFKHDRNILHNISVYFNTIKIGFKKINI